MKKSAYFDTYWASGWPALEWLAPYFLDSPERRWPFAGGNDTAVFDAEGVEGTEHLPAGKGRIEVHLSLWGNPEHGVIMMHERWGGPVKETYTSRGDLSRLRELVRSAHDTPLPVGLFVPFKAAWNAVKEFIETDGALPKSIEWIANRDLPENTFPDPGRFGDVL